MFSEHRQDHFLVHRQGALGDLVHTIPLLATIKQHIPLARIVYLTSTVNEELLRSCSWVDEVVGIEGKLNLFNFFAIKDQLQKNLEGEKFYAGIIDLQSSWRSKLLFDGLVTSVNKYDYAKNPQSAHVWLNFAETYRPLAPYLLEQKLAPRPYFTLPEPLVERALLRVKFNPYKQNIALIPGVGKHRPHRAWPAKNWLNLIRIFNSRESPTPDLYLIGGEEERLLCQELQSSMPREAIVRVVNLAGELSLLELAGLLGKCDTVIGGDTGPTHLAGAMGTNTLGLFGPTSAKRHLPFGGLGLRADEYQCAQSCTEKLCARNVANCMEALTPEQVWLVLKEDQNRIQVDDSSSGQAFELY